jgi:dTDP-glucose 4,6-dehydratase
MKILVTGHKGFIFTNFMKLVLPGGHEWLGVDNETYAANIQEGLCFFSYANYRDFTIDICDISELEKAFLDRPDYIIHAAAESHVDNSIKDPGKFYRTNVQGTINILEMCRKYPVKKLLFINTDECQGDNLFPVGENAPTRPSSPYSASKASAEAFVQAYGRTYSIPYLITRTCNNYGPYQNQEKLIPTIIRKISRGEEVPVYGDGKQVREWIYVKDNCKMIYNLLFSNFPHPIVNIGSGIRLTNLELIDKIGKIINKPYKIKYIKDRAGHDFSYNLDSSLLKNTNLYEVSDFETSLQETIAFYLSRLSGN